jgi:hypothetical protein
MIETHYGIRYTSPTGSHIVDYGTREDDARRNYPHRVSRGVRKELLRRTVHIGQWKPAPANDAGER